MMRSIFAKTLHDSRRGLIGWATGMLVMVVYVGSVYPSIRDNTAFDDLIKKYPEALRTMFGLGVGDAITSGPGYLQVEFFSLVLPIIFIVFGIAAGARAIAGEEDDRTIDLLLATPVSRRRVILEKVGAYLALSGVLALVCLGSLLVVNSVFAMGVATANLAVATVAVALLGIHFAMLALAVGALVGRRAVAIGVASAVAIGTFLWNGLAPLAPALSGTQWVSPWHHALGDAVLRNGLAADHALVLVGAAVGWAVAAIIAFERRDLRS